MKKGLIIFIALLLAVPAVSFAGSATSRWDMTIGGYVKMDLGWADSLVGVDYRTAPRNNFAGADSLAKQSGNLYWVGGETRLNFMVKGPDAWSAKTNAFVEGDFRGITGSGSAAYAPGGGAATAATPNAGPVSSGDNYGLFTLRHAYMQFVWPKTSVILGHTWQPWGIIPSLNMLAFSENHFFKGATRVPQIRLTQTLSNNFTFQLGIASGSSNQLTASGSNYFNESTASQIPHFSGELVYSTDACGRLGPWPLKIGLGGFVGKDKFFYYDQAASQTIGTQSITTYAGSFWGYIPIIPEKKGNKAGGLGVTWTVFGGKGLGLYLPAYPGSYTDNGAFNTFNRTAAAGYATNAFAAIVNITEPVTWGAWGQATLYATDALFFNVLYGFQSNAISTVYMNTVANAGVVKYIDNIVVNAMYDVNAAIRFGLEYTRVRTEYAANAYPAAGTIGPITGRSGDLNAVRIGAYYFF